MIGQIGSFEDVVEQGRSTAQNVKNSAVSGAKNVAQTVTAQITGSQATSANDQGTNEASSTSTQQQMSNDDAKKFLQDLYGKSDPTQNQNNQKSQTSVPQKSVPTPTETIKTALGIPETGFQQSAPAPSQTIKNAMGIPEIQSNQKTPEELVRIAALRQQLHGDYYQGLVNPQKPEEESVTKKIEREDQEQQMAELETDKEKPPPIVNPNMKQGTAENVVGVSG